jgi:hypothetical protein
MLLCALAGVAIAGAGCDSMGGPIPAQPAYDSEVRPLLMAHCVRCHGAGGMLNLPTEPTGPNAPTIPSVADPNTQQGFTAVYNLYLNQFDNSPGKNGAAGMAKILGVYVKDSAKPPTFMPPAPAQPLDDWAIGVLDNWGLNPICSNSPNPDPSICPNGPGLTKQQ